MGALKSLLFYVSKCIKDKIECTRPLSSWVVKLCLHHPLVSSRALWWVFLWCCFGSWCSRFAQVLSGQGKLQLFFLQPRSLLVQLDPPLKQHLRTGSSFFWCSTFGALGVVVNILVSNVSRRGWPSIESASSVVWCKGQSYQMFLVGELALPWAVRDHLVRGDASLEGQW